MFTVEQYEQLPDTGVRTELVNGEVIELATGTILHDYVRDEVRTNLRGWSGGLALAEREFPFKLELGPVPDLAVEIVSRTDPAADLREKIHEYLEAGVSPVWVLYLESRDADVWNRGRAGLLGVDTVTADCLPGFSLPLAKLFPND